jgi:hypothetical protein
VKLPIGVADLLSLGCAVRPCEPRCAVIAEPCRCQPDEVFVQACRVPVVLPVDAATTVTTCRAVPVFAFNGRPVDTWWLLVGDGDGAECVNERCVVGLGSGVDFGATGCDDVAGRLAAGELSGAPCPLWTADVHPISTSDARAPAVSTRIGMTVGAGTRPPSHDTPMRTLGWVDGLSHRISDTSLDCEIATQPAVAAPLVTCRKNALPAPGVTGKRL